MLSTSPAARARMRSERLTAWPAIGAAAGTRGRSRRTVFRHRRSPCPRSVSWSASTSSAEASTTGCCRRHSSRAFLPGKGRRRRRRAFHSESDGSRAAPGVTQRRHGLAPQRLMVDCNGQLLKVKAQPDESKVGLKIHTIARFDTAITCAAPPRRRLSSAAVDADILQNEPRGGCSLPVA